MEQDKLLKVSRYKDVSVILTHVVKSQLERCKLQRRRD